MFDIGTMITCSERQSTFQAKCAVGSVPPLICVDPTSSSAILSTTAITTHYQPVTSFTTTILTGSSTIEHIVDPASYTSYNVITFTIMNSSYTIYMTLSSGTISVTSFPHIGDIEGLISGLVVLSIVMFGLGGVLGGLLTVLWNKRRYNKGICVTYTFNSCDNTIRSEESYQ